MNKINCLFITASKPKAARHLYFDKLAKSFAKTNIKVIVIYDNNYSNSDFKNDNLISVTWPSQRPTKIKDFIFFYKLIKEHKPDAIFSSFGSVNVSNIVGYFMRVKFRINFLLSTPLIFDDKGRIGLIKKKRKKLIYNIANLYIANSEGVLSELEDYYKFHFSPYLILPNLIDDDCMEGKGRKKQLVIVGALSKLKGHDYLINQFQNLLNYEPEIKLIVVGDGKEKEFLKRKYNKLVSNDKIIFKGKLNRKQTLELIGESLIHVSSSIEEAFGFVNIESLMQATPIICSVTSGSRLILKENYNGEFFDLHKEDSLLNAYLKIIPSWNSYSSNARKCFLDFYSLDENIKKHKNLILNKLNDV
jgi:glycosyltransferase involved in cell wall biosynthesis